MVKFLTLVLPFAFADRVRRQGIPTIASTADAFDNMVTWAGAENHGCHCPAIASNGEQGYAGMAIDDADKTCQTWGNARTCLTLTGGACAGVSSDALPSYTFVGNCNVIGDNCARALCEADVFFSSKLNGYEGSIALTIISNPQQQCVRVPGSGWSGHGKNRIPDSCCGAASEFLQRYSSINEICTNEGVVIAQDCPAGQERNGDGDCVPCPTDMYSNGGSKCVACDAKADVFIIYDGSGTMSNDGKWGQQKNFLRSLLTSFDVSPDGLRVAANQYNKRQRLAWTFSEGDTLDKVDSETSSISQADTQTCGWCSQMGRAYRKAQNTFINDGRSDAQRIVIALSDGYNTGSKEGNNSHGELVDSLQWFGDNNVEVYLIKVGTGNTLSGYSQDLFVNNPANWFQTGPDGWDGLTGISDLIKNRICTESL